MYSETKVALRKAFEISKIIFGVGPEQYSKLLRAVSRINLPTKHELEEYLKSGLCLEDATGLELKRRYEEAAIAAGFTKKHGFAMLQYAALLKEIET